jgi:hypothetical protein
LRAGASAFGSGASVFISRFGASRGSNFIGAACAVEMAAVADIKKSPHPLYF